MTALRLGTRRSPLALAQSTLVANALRSRGHEVELVEITTVGDHTQAAGTPIAETGVGVFVNALRDALRGGEVDLAVHSAKDLPTAQPDDLVVAAVPAREDPRDVLCGAGLADLSPGSRVGTGSPRRAAQLHALGLGLDVVAIRGNVGTRVGRVGADLEAVVVARAGLSRLGRLDAIAEVLDPLTMLPSPGQGALAIECTLFSGVEATLKDLDDPDSRAAIAAERAVMGALEAGCTAPVAALADIAEDEIYLRALVAAPDGSVVIRRSATGRLTDPTGLGLSLANELLADGAGDLWRTA
jgi:hydroxymethylbilane synthase